MCVSSDGTHPPAAASRAGITTDSFCPQPSVKDELLLLHDSDEHRLTLNLTLQEKEINLHFDFARVLMVSCGLCDSVRKSTAVHLSEFRI